MDPITESDLSKWKAWADDLDSDIAWHGIVSRLISEVEAHRRSVRAYEDEARKFLADYDCPLMLAEGSVEEAHRAIATLLSRVARAERERAAGIADKISGDPPSTPSGRHDDWQIGHQDGAMECAAAIRAAEPGER